MSFREALERTLATEGRDSDDPLDPGGPTRCGISLRFLRAIGDPRHPFDLSDEDIRQLYLKEFWLKYGYDEIADPLVAAKVFDLSVNMGPKQAHVLLQRACRSCSRPVEEDGKLGPKTLAAVNASEPMCLLAALRSEAAGHYRLLMAKDPKRERFTGWIGRGYA